MLVLNQCMCISEADLSSVRHVWAKYNDEVPDVSGSYQSIKMSRLKLKGLKDLCFERAKKIVKDECI